MPPPPMRKFKQRLVICPRLCQAPPQGQPGTAVPFTLSPPDRAAGRGPRAPTHTLRRLLVTLSTPAPVFPKKLYQAHPPRVLTPYMSIFVELQMTEMQRSRVLPRTTELEENSHLQNTANASKSKDLPTPSHTTPLKDPLPHTPTQCTPLALPAHTQTLSNQLRAPHFQHT